MARDPSRPSSWKGDEQSALPGGKASGPKYAWKPAEAAGKPGTQGRKLKVIGLTGLMAVVVAGIAYLIYLLFPPKTICLLVVAGDFRPHVDDLSLPCNIYGHRAAGDFLDWTKLHDRDKWFKILGDRKEQQESPWPVDYNLDGGDWLTALADRREKMLIIFVGQPGGTDENGLPFVFKEDGGQLAVKDIVQRLRDIKGKKKLLILDCTQTPTDWRHGIAGHNRFTDGLLKIEDEIKRDPELLVYCASSPNQRSWVSEDLGGSVFAYYLRDGLAGGAAAEPGKAITAAELIAYVDGKVDQWVLRNRADNQNPFRQKPLVLPRGADEEPWARKFIVGYGDRDYQSPADPPTAVFAADKLLDAWGRCDQLAKSTPAPWVTTPRLWRRYRELLLRYEQLLRAGETNTAEKLAGSIESVRALITAARTAIGGEAIGASIAMPAAVGRQLVLTQGQLGELEGEKDDLMTRFQRIAGADQADAVRMKYTEELLNGLIKQPGDLARIAERLVVVNRGQPHPIEAHLPIMMHRYPKPEGWAKPADELVRLATSTRVLAEQAALSVGTAGGYPYAERIPPQFWAKVTAADGERRRAEDRIFAASKYQAEAKKLLGQVSPKYQQIVADMAKIRNAVSVRDEVFADLPALSEWVALARPGNMNELLPRVTDLWKDAHDLADAVEALDPLMSGGAAPENIIAQPNKNDTRRRDLVALAHDVKEQFSFLQSLYVEEVRGLTSRETQTDLQRIEYALTVPGPLMSASGPLVTADQRVALVEQSRRISGQLIGGRVEDNRNEAVSEKDLAAYQARLAKAMMGTSVMRRLAEYGPRDPDRFPTDSDNDLGKQLAAHWSELGKKTDETSTADGKSAKPLPGRERFGLLAGSKGENLREPAAEARTERWDRLFRGLARRATLDHWYDENGDPYTEVVAGQYYSALSRRDEGAAAREQLKKDRDKGLLVVEPPRFAPALTINRPLRFAFGIKRISPELFDPGFATIVPKMSGPVLAIQSETEPYPVSLAKDSPAEVDLAFNAPIEGFDKIKDVQLTLWGYYRGQKRDDAVAKMPVRAEADLTVEFPEPTKDPKIAARAAVAEPGALAIILDCSGSMNNPMKGRSGSKFSEAKAALRSMLPRIANGTKVTIWAYGHTTASDKSEIQRLLPPTDWNVANADTIYLKHIDGLVAKNYTPLVQTMFEAAMDKDLVKEDRLITLVVLSDGMNQERDPSDPNKGIKVDTTYDAKIAARFEQLFKELAVSIQVVLYSEDKVEQDHAKLQLEAGIKAMSKKVPSELFFTADEKALSLFLANSVRPRIAVSKGSDDVGKFFATLPGRPLTEWFPLQDGPYRLLCRLGRQDIYLERGDRLPLEVGLGATNRNRSQFKRVIMAKEADGVGNVALLDEKRNFVLGRVKGEGGRRSALWSSMFTVEPLTPLIAGELRLERPKFAWWEIKHAGVPTFPRRATLAVTYDRPAPTWEYKCREWVAPAGTPEKADVQVWVTEKEPRYEKQPLAAGQTISSDVPMFNGAAVIEWAGFLNTKIPSEDGPPKVRNCLVVQLRAPQGGRFAVQVEGVKSTAQAHKYYFEDNCYTAVFAVDSGANQQINIRVIDIEQFKKDPATVKLEKQVDE